MMRKVNVLGIQVDTYLLAEVLALIHEKAAARERLLITHVHVTGLHLGYENQWFRNFLNQTDLVYCDGMGVKLGAKLLGDDIPERYTLADWYPQLVSLIHQNDFSLFLLGNPPGVAKQAAGNLVRDYPGLRIAGTHHGYFDKSQQGVENQQIVAQINQAKPDLLLVGFGMPLQEKWMMENWAHLDVSVGITVGAIFEYMAGTMRHGPDWMTQYYMEWLFRLFDKPTRYAGRYLRDNPLLVVRALRQRFLGLPFPEE